MKVLMTGGGTGGHINPAVAIANTIKKNHPQAPRSSMRRYRLVSIM